MEGRLVMEDVEIWEEYYGRGDYIIGPYHIEFYNVCIREPRLLTNHQMILAELK